MSRHTSFLIFNFLGLQITWAACAYGATHQFPMLGAIIGVMYIIAHFMFTPNPRQDLFVMFTIGALGIFIDHVNTYANLVSFVEPESMKTIIPFWLMSLWLVFSLMLPHSLGWLRKNLWLAALLGGIGGSFSYWLGHKLGAIILLSPLHTSVSIYFIEWAIIVPVAFMIMNAKKNQALNQT